MPTGDCVTDGDRDADGEPEPVPSGDVEALAEPHRVLEPDVEGEFEIESVAVGLCDATADTVTDGEPVTDADAPADSVALADGAPRWATRATATHRGAPA